MSSRRPGGLFTLAWGLLVIVSLTLVAAGGYLLYSPVDSSWFAEITGQSWEALQSSQPGVADYVVLLARLVAAAAIGFGILALFVTWFGVRDRSQLAVNVMWTLPLLVLGLALVFVMEGNMMVGIALAGVTVILAIALVIARRAL